VKVYVVICHDRHVNDMITVHSTREGADRQVEEFKALYADYGYVWTERDYGRSVGWVRYVDSHDDGPKARIEETELRP
jgi:hypothetical protein